MGGGYTSIFPRLFFSPGLSRMCNECLEKNYGCPRSIEPICISVSEATPPETGL